MKRWIAWMMLLALLAVTSTTALADIVDKTYDSGRYMGHTKNGQFHGFGTYYFNDGSYYVGLWENGHYSGIGVYNSGTNSDSNVVQAGGIFKGSKLHGEGAVLFRDGTRIEGMFENGQPVPGNTQTTQGVYKLAFHTLEEESFIGEVLVQEEYTPNGYGLQTGVRGGKNFTFVSRFQNGVPMGLSVVIQDGEYSVAMMRMDGYELLLVVMSDGREAYPNPDPNPAPKPSTERCFACNGTLICAVCHGVGRYYIPSYIGTGGSYVNCASCQGSGRCKFCK